MKKKSKIEIEAEWVNDFRPQMERRAQLLRKEIQTRKQALENAPEGSLRVRKGVHTCQYFHITETGDTLGVFIKKDNQKLAKALSQKFYDKKFIAEAQRQLKILDKYLRSTDDEAIGRIYEELHAGKKELVNPVYDDKETLVRNWESVEYQPGYFMEGEAIHYTAKGERVRSKAEENIANMLNMYKIPYRYEFPIILDNLERRPDFTCLNVRTRKEIIWEHFGKMDDAGYAIKNVDKINIYMKNNYVQGSNFIMTFETMKSPLSTATIKRMIETHLL